MRRGVGGLALVAACGGPVEFASSDLRLDGAEDGIDSVSSDLCVSPAGGVYAVWSDDRSGTLQVWLAASADEGQSWSEPVAVSHSPADALAPQLACASLEDAAPEQDGVYIVWEDTRDGELANHNVYFQSSLDGGQTWRPEDLRVTPDPEGRSMHLGPRIAAGGSEVYLTWFDGRAGAFDIYAQGSTTRGETWNQPVRLDGDAPGQGYSAWPDIATDGEGHCYVAWEDSRDGASDIYVAATGNGGFSFNASQRLDAGVDGQNSPDDPGEHDSFRPSVAALGSSVAVAWHDERNGSGRDVLVSVSSDHGVAWYGQAARVESTAPGVADSINPAVGLVDDPDTPEPTKTVQVAWQDHRADAYDIFTRTLPTSAGEQDVRLDDGAAGSGQSLNVRVATEGNTVVVAWEDRRDDTGDGYNDLYYRFSRDGGRSWHSDDLRLDSIAPGTSFATGLDIALRNDVLYALWVDGRGGSSDVYFQRLGVGESAGFVEVAAR